MPFSLMKQGNLRKKRHSIGTLVFFAVVFTGMGLFFWLDFGLIPLVQVIRSRSWTAVPAVVTESFAEPFGRSGRVCIRFEYVWKNRKRHGNRYDFFHSRTSCGRGAAREKIIASHPTGKRIECLVNPDDPTESVVSRTIPWCAWSGILLPLVFIVIGIKIGWRAVRTIRTKLKYAASRKEKLSQ